MVRVSGSFGAFSGLALHEGRLRSPSAIRTATLAAVPVGARTCFTSIQTISCSSAIATAANTTEASQDRGASLGQQQPRHHGGERADDGERREMEPVEELLP